MHKQIPKYLRLKVRRYLEYMFEYKKQNNLRPEEQIITANPDLKKIENKGLDFIIMGCDGIW